MGHSQPIRGCSRDEDVQRLQPRVVDIDVVDAPRDLGQQPVDSLMCREALETFGERRDIRGLRDVGSMAVQLVGRLAAMAGGVGEPQIVIDPASSSQFGGCQWPTKSPRWWPTKSPHPSELFRVF